MTYLTLFALVNEWVELVLSLEAIRPQDCLEHELFDFVIPRSFGENGRRGELYRSVEIDGL